METLWLRGILRKLRCIVANTELIIFKIIIIELISLCAYFDVQSLINFCALL